MQNEIPHPYYLQQHEITKNQLSNFSQMPNAAESLQMTMNLYLMGGSSITSNKPLMVFTGTDPEYSVEDYLNAVTANLILIIGPKPINTPLHQNWIHRRTALIQTTFGKPFISKYIPTINILNSKIHIKDKYTKTKNTALTFFQRLNKQPPFFQNFIPFKINNGNT